MEGEIKPNPGEERFAQFLLERARSFNRLPDLEAHALQLFIQLEYGSPDAKRILPMDIALASPLHKAEAEGLIADAHEKTRKDQEEYRHRSNDLDWRGTLDSFEVKMEEMPNCPNAETHSLDCINLWHGSTSFELFLTAYVPNYYSHRAVALWEMVDDGIKEGIVEDHRHIKRVLRERELFEEWYQKHPNWWEKFWPRIAEHKYNRILKERLKHNHRYFISNYSYLRDEFWKNYWDVRRIYVTYFWLRMYPEIHSLIIPFTTRKFFSHFRD
jgi:hypothetical protein